MTTVASPGTASRGPQFIGATRIGRDLTTNSLLQSGGLGGSDPVVYYPVMGVNSCGARGTVAPPCAPRTQEPPERRVPVAAFIMGRPN